MAVDKSKQSSLRVKYIRLLDRFMKSIVGYLSKTEKLTHEAFETKVQNSYKYLESMEEKAQLHKAELVDLEKLVERIVTLSKDYEKDLEESRLEILREANRIEKDKNRNRYKREKRSKKSFDDQNY